MPPAGITGEGVAWARLTAAGVVAGGAVGREVGVGVDEGRAVGVKVAVGDEVPDKGGWPAGTGGPKGEQLNPAMATAPKTAITQKLLELKGGVEAPCPLHARFIGNRVNMQLVSTIYILSATGRKVKEG